MKQVFFGVVAAAFLVTCPEAAAQGDPTVYGATPAVSEVQISPDGSTVAMLRAAGDTMPVVFFDLANLDAKPAGIQVGGGKARDIVWADNDHVLVLASGTGRMSVTTGLETIEFFRWFSVSKSTAKSVMFFGNEGRTYIPSAGQLVATPANRPSEAIFNRFGALLAGNLRTSSDSRIEAGQPDTYDWIVSSLGEAVARIDYDSAKQETVLNSRLPGESGFRRVKAYSDKAGAAGGIAFYGQAPNGEGYLASIRGEQDTRSIVAVDSKTGEFGRTIYSNADYGIDGVAYDYARATATGVRYTDDLPRTVHFDPADQKTQDALAKALPGSAPMIVSKSADGMKLIVKAIYSDHPDQYFLFDRAAKSLSMIATSYPALDGKVAAKKEKFDYIAADGLNIRGYLTVPNGASKTNMPLIVLPHGGPQGRDDMAFDWWSFFYAANGYLVYQPNFRGSDGYGANFVAAGFGEWGRKMQDDITEGVGKLIADGVVDAKRVCIVGGSYGGYAALAGATLTPDLYACAVSVNGVSDLPALIGRTTKRSELAEDYWDVRIGSRFRDATALSDVSPTKIADRAKAPILLIHGRDDTVVPYSHALRMHDALRDAGKTVELVEMKGEDHWLSRSTSRTVTLAKSLEFIDQHIGD